MNDMETERHEYSKITNKIFPFGVLAFTLFLLGTFLLRFSNETILNGTTLSAYPQTISLNNIWNGSFQKSWEQWFNDNFYGHAVAVKCHNQIEYSVFRDGVMSLHGEDGYLIGGAYPYAAGARALSNTLDEYDAYAIKLLELQTKLAENGKDFIYLVSPLKAEVYPEKLPWSYKILADRYADKGVTNHSALVNALERYHVNYYDMTNDMLRMKESADFDVFSSTGHHWTLTAVASEMKTFFQNIQGMTPHTRYPAVNISEITNELFPTDRDLLDLENVFWGRSSDSYQSPAIQYPEQSDSCVYLFGTSMGVEVATALYQDVQNRAFDSLIYSHYFTLLYTYDENGYDVKVFNPDDAMVNIGVMQHVKNSDLIVMESQGASGILGTHTKFLDYVNENLDKLYYRPGDNIVYYSDDSTGVALEGFYDYAEGNEFRWTNINTGTVHMYGNELRTVSGDINLHINMMSYGVNRNVNVLFNGQFLDTLQVIPAPSDYAIVIPENMIQSDENTITLQMEGEILSPKDLGESEDPRYFGIGIYLLSLEVDT